MSEEFTFDLERVHQANLEILKAVKTICDRHGITYLIDSGTLLGAVRHKGFTPWDDDVDLCFRREEQTATREPLGKYLSLPAPAASPAPAQ